MNKKMYKNTKNNADRDLNDWLECNETEFGPARFILQAAENQRTNQASKYRPDKIVTVRWEDQQDTLIVEAKKNYTPKAIEQAIQQLKRMADSTGKRGMLLVPYLSEDQLDNIKQQGVSGIDLCGNGILIIPQRLLIYKTGNSNKYPQNARIQNIYRGASSLVVRAFMLQGQYESTNEIQTFIQKRGGDVSLSTISKVCTTLENDLIIRKARNKNGTITQVIQPEKLLSCLKANYSPPHVNGVVSAKLTISLIELRKILEGWCKSTNESIVQTGSSSTENYATMVREPLVQFYCTRVTSLVERLSQFLETNSRFPNVEFIETQDPTVYFDTQDNFISSPVQTYLELANGEKREKETSEQIYRDLIQKTVTQVQDFEWKI